MDPKIPDALQEAPKVTSPEETQKLMLEAQVQLNEKLQVLKGQYTKTQENLQNLNRSILALSAQKTLVDSILTPETK